MHLKIQPLSQGLKFSNSKPGCRVSAIHFFVKYRYHQWLSGIELIHMSICFQLIIPGSTPVSLRKANRGLRLSRNFRTPERDHHHHIYSLCEYIFELDHVNLDYRSYASTANRTLNLVCINPCRHHNQPFTNNKQLQDPEVNVLTFGLITAAIAGFVWNWFILLGTRTVSRIIAIII